jgi:hypothetical protein
MLTLSYLYFILFFNKFGFFEYLSKHNKKLAGRQWLVLKPNE